MPASEFPPKFGLKILFEPCTEEQIVAYEDQIGTRLPEEYRRFLLTYNGVDFSENPAFPLADSWDDDDYGEVYVLYGLPKEASENDLREEQLGYDFQYRVPKNIIAIGRNFATSRIAISLSRSDRGKVYYWQPGAPWEYDEDAPPRAVFLRDAHGI